MEVVVYTSTNAHAAKDFAGFKEWISQSFFAEDFVFVHGDARAVRRHDPRPAVLFRFSPGQQAKSVYADQAAIDRLVEAHDYRVAVVHTKGGYREEHLRLDSDDMAPLVPHFQVVLMNQNKITKDLEVSDPFLSKQRDTLSVFLRVVVTPQGTEEAKEAYLRAKKQAHAAAEASRRAQQIQETRARLLTTIHDIERAQALWSRGFDYRGRPGALPLYDRRPGVVVRVTQEDVAARFEIVKVLGQGFNGKVELVSDRLTGRLLAAKTQLVEGKQGGADPHGRFASLSGAKKLRVLGMPGTGFWIPGSKDEWETFDAITASLKDVYADAATAWHIERHLFAPDKSRRHPPGFPSHCVMPCVFGVLDVTDPLGEESEEVTLCNSRITLMEYLGGMTDFEAILGVIHSRKGAKEELRPHRAQIHARFGEIFLAFMEMLLSLHGTGAVYLDFKPPNIMVDLLSLRSGHELRVAIVDYGRCAIREGLSQVSSEGRPSARVFNRAYAESTNQFLVDHRVYKLYREGRLFEAACYIDIFLLLQTVSHNFCEWFVLDGLDAHPPGGCRTWKWNGTDDTWPDDGPYSRIAAPVFELFTDKHKLPSIDNVAKVARVVFS